MAKPHPLLLVATMIFWLGLAVPEAAQAPKKPRPQALPQKPPAVSLRRPDLRPADVSIQWNGQKVSGELPRGEPYQFVCTVSGAGIGTSGAFKVGHYLDGALVGSQAMGSIQAGASAVSSWTYSPDRQVAGAHTYECFVDLDNAAPESDEANNKATASFSFAAMCKVDRDCASGACVDGVCCNESCAGNCRYCAFPMHVGTCMAVPDGQDPRRACQTSIGGHPACGGACYSGQCAFVDVGTPCGICSCCDGTGRCTATPPDDERCGVIDCSGLDTADRIHQDLTSRRCVALGLCAEPNDPATCTSYTELHR